MRRNIQTRTPPDGPKTFLSARFYQIAWFLDKAWFYMLYNPVLQQKFWYEYLGTGPCAIDKVKKKGQGHKNQVIPCTIKPYLNP